MMCFLCDTQHVLVCQDVYVCSSQMLAALQINWIQFLALKFCMQFESLVMCGYCISPTQVAAVCYDLGMPQKLTITCSDFFFYSQQLCFNLRTWGGVCVHIFPLHSLHSLTIHQHSNCICTHQPFTSIFPIVSANVLALTWENQSDPRCTTQQTVVITAQCGMSSRCFKTLNLLKIVNMNGRRWWLIFTFV